MKSVRKKRILELIAEKNIETQQQLAGELRSAGFHVTQATLSRDIRELGLVKMTDRNGLTYYTSPGLPVSQKNEGRLERLLREAVVSVDSSENLIIVKTYPGEAQGVAYALDNINWGELIGTVAGDDTVLIIVKPKEATQTVVERITALSGR